LDLVSFIVKCMQAEAEAHKDEDSRRAELVEAKNRSDAMVATAEKSLKDAGDKVPADVKEKVEEKVKKVKEVTAKEGATKEDIEAATKDLSDELSKIGEAMYKDKGQPAGQPGAEAASEEKSEDKKDDKKKDEKVEEGEVVE